MQLEWLGTFVWVAVHNGVSTGVPVGHNMLALPLDGGERGVHLIPGRSPAPWVSHHIDLVTPSPQAT